MGDWEHADQSDYEQYLKQQQAELLLHTLNDMTLDERITEYIEWQNSEFDKRLMVDAHLEIINLRTENARLRQILVDVCNSTGGACTEDVSVDFLAHLPGEVEAMAKKNARLEYALADAAAQLTDAVQRAQEAEYNLHLIKQQADAFHAENGRLRQQQERITTIARPYNGGLDCEGDGSGTGCKNRAVWEIQAMQDDGSNYVYVCNDHLSNYQRWAAGDGRSPLVFEK